jgi:hypothetical protein
MSWMAQMMALLLAVQYFISIQPLPVYTSRFTSGCTRDCHVVISW